MNTNATRAISNVSVAAVTGQYAECAPVVTTGVSVAAVNGKCLTAVPQNSTKTSQDTKRTRATCPTKQKTSSDPNGTARDNIN